MQGSAYSADLFARVLDAHLYDLFEYWNSECEPTWLKNLHALIYTDDLILLATSREQIQMKLREICPDLFLIGLHLAKTKCQLLVSPCVPVAATIYFIDRILFQEVSSLVFVGVLIGFHITAAQMLGWENNEVVLVF